MNPLWTRYFPHLVAVIGLGLLLLAFYNWAGERGARPWREKHQAQEVVKEAASDLAKMREAEALRETREKERRWLEDQAANLARVARLRADFDATDGERKRRLQSAVDALASCRVRPTGVPGAAVSAPATGGVPAGGPERSTGEGDSGGGLEAFRRRIESLNLDYETCRSTLQQLRNPQP